MKNWTGNKNSIFKTLGASNHTKEDRETNDYYATDPIATKLLLTLEIFNKNILEPSCGEGHISNVLIKNGYNVTSSDIIDRGYGIKKNFYDYTYFDGDIVTNPPYKYAIEFIEHSMRIILHGNKIAMFLKLQFLESKKRKELFLKYPPKIVYVSSNRIMCAKNGEFEYMRKAGGSAVAYGWYIWEKGYKGDTILKWFN